MNTLSWVLLLTGIVSGRNSMEVISSLLEGARWRKERSSPDDNPQPSLPLTRKIRKSTKNRIEKVMNRSVAVNCLFHGPYSTALKM